MKKSLALILIYLCFSVSMGAVHAADQEPQDVTDDKPDQDTQESPAAIKKVSNKDKQAAALNLSKFSEMNVDYDIYVIHPGDKLNIQVFREKELSGLFTVNSSGKITFPLLGDIIVDGLSLEDLKQFLVDALGREFVINPQIQVDFEDSPNKSVAILGQVSKPGNYILSPNLTLVRLISQIGGFTSIASTSDVKIARATGNGKKISVQLDVQQIIKGEIEDVNLMPGDMIFVDKLDEKKIEKKLVKEQVSILGQISKPGNYDLSTEMTLVKLISEAGGFTPLAAVNRVKVIRHAKDGKEQSMLVDMGKVLDGRAKDMKLEPKDLVVVPESFF